MPIFTNKAAQEKISGLEARVGELEADFSDAQTELESLRAEVRGHAENVAVLEAQLNEADSALESLTSEHAAALENLTNAQAKLETFDAEVEAAVVNRVASLGFTGELPESNKEDRGESQKITRAAFRALSPADRMAFVKDGGEII